MAPEKLFDLTGVQPATINSVLQLYADLREKPHLKQIAQKVLFMPDLINAADCVITKSGPATVMETLSAGKPLILASYVRGQELGNMLYVTQNQLGWYIPQPRKIIKKVKEIITDDSLFHTIEQKIDSMRIKNGLDAIADFIYHF